MPEIVVTSGAIEILWVQPVNINKNKINNKLYYELMDDTIKKQVDGYISQISKKYNLKILDYKNIYLFLLLCLKNS